jgi:hypothetical protein
VRPREDLKKSFGILSENPMKKESESGGSPKKKNRERFSGQRERETIEENRGGERGTYGRKRERKRERERASECVCVCVRERTRKNEKRRDKKKKKRERCFVIYVCLSIHVCNCSVFERHLLTVVCLRDTCASVSILDDFIFTYKHMYMVHIHT